MIKFALRCAQGHEFDSWFQSGPAFEQLQLRGLVACPQCGATSVEKALMAPAVATSSAPRTTPENLPAPKAPQDGGNAQQVAIQLQQLRDEIETHSDYVGERFASEARAMFLGDIPNRPIYGEAQAEEARALIEDGVPVLPLPFVPRRKTN